MILMPFSGPLEEVGRKGANAANMRTGSEMEKCPNRSVAGRVRDGGDLSGVWEAKRDWRLQKSQD